MPLFKAPIQSLTVVIILHYFNFLEPRKVLARNSDKPLRTATHNRHLEPRIVNIDPQYQDFLLISFIRLLINANALNI